MGYRLHSATIYEVKYGKCEAFNWGCEHINPIIECLAEGDCWGNSEYLPNADTLEADRSRLLANVDKIIQPDENWSNQAELDQLIGEMENDTECDIDRVYLHKCLKQMIEESDPRNAFVYFAWF